MRRTVTVLIISVLLAACAPKNSEQPIEKVIDTALDNARKQALAMAERYAPLEGRLPRSWVATPQTAGNTTNPANPASPASANPANPANPASASTASPASPNPAGEDISSDSRWWCSGFFPGVLWYLYENSGDKKTLEYAKLFTDRVEREKYTTTNHDVGFMLMSSFGNGLRITGEERYKEVLETGARSLATRFNPKIGAIRSWDHGADLWQYPVIIDNMMNLELILRAAEVATAGENHGFADSLRRIAISHADKTNINHVRPDFGTYHVVSYDPQTGRVDKRQTHQGYADSSTWSRGEAWALYGFTMMFRMTGELRYLNVADGIAAYMIFHPNMPADFIPYWDYNAPDIPGAPRDASAAAIMASALIELADYSIPEMAEVYLRVAESQIRTLASPQYTAPVGGNGNFILMHGVGGYPLGTEIDVPLTYADYYYVEALTRLRKRLRGDGPLEPDAEVWRQQMR